MKIINEINLTNITNLIFAIFYEVSAQYRRFHICQSVGHRQVSLIRSPTGSKVGTNRLSIGNIPIDSEYSAT